MDGPPGSQYCNESGVGIEADHAVVIVDLDVHMLVDVDGVEKILPKKQEVANLLHKGHEELFPDSGSLLM
jgi:hypothetical protein